MKSLREKESAIGSGVGMRVGVGGTAVNVAVGVGSGVSVGVGIAVDVGDAIGVLVGVDVGVRIAVAVGGGDGAGAVTYGVGGIGVEVKASALGARARVGAGAGLGVDDGAGVCVARKSSLRDGAGETGITHDRANRAMVSDARIRAALHRNIDNIVGTPLGGRWNFRRLPRLPESHANHTRGRVALEHPSLVRVGKKCGFR